MSCCLIGINLGVIKLSGAIIARLSEWSPSLPPVGGCHRIDTASSRSSNGNCCWKCVYFSRSFIPHRPVIFPRSVLKFNPILSSCCIIYIYIYIFNEGYSFFQPRQQLQYRFYGNSGLYIPPATVILNVYRIGVENWEAASA